MRLLYMLGQIISIEKQAVALVTEADVHVPHFLMSKLKHLSEILSPCMIRKYRTGTNNSRTVKSSDK
jgi:hypothetical protein